MSVEILYRAKYRELVMDIQNSGGVVVATNNRGNLLALDRPKFKFTLADRRMWIRISDKWCRYCGIGEAETVDHVIPKAKGGKNTERNMVGCCIPCNSRKGSLLPKEAGMQLSIPSRWFRMV